MIRTTRCFLRTMAPLAVVLIPLVATAGEVESTPLFNEVAVQKEGLPANAPVLSLNRAVYNALLAVES